MEYYKKRSCVCNPLAFGLSRSCTKRLNGQGVSQKNEIKESKIQTRNFTRHFDRSLIRKFSLHNSLRSDNAPNLLRTSQNDGKISMVLDLRFFYFVFLRYLKFTDNKSNKSKLKVCMLNGVS